MDEQLSILLASFDDKKTLLSKVLVPLKKKKTLYINWQQTFELISLHKHKIEILTPSKMNDVSHHEIIVLLRNLHWTLFIDNAIETAHVCSTNA